MNLQLELFPQERVTLPLTILFRDLPKGELFCSLCEEMDIRTVDQLSEKQFEKEYPAIGDQSLKDLHTRYRQFTTSRRRYKTPTDPSNDRIRFKTLALNPVKIGKKELALIDERDLPLFSHFNLVDLNDARINGIPPIINTRYKEVFSLFEKPFDKIAEQQLYTLRKNHLRILLRRAAGHTLKQIAGREEISTERVRQLTLKAQNGVYGFTCIIRSLLPELFHTTDILALIPDEMIASGYMLSMQIVPSLTFIPYASLYIDTGLLPQNWEQKFTKAVLNWAKDGVDIEKERKPLTRKLKREKLAFFTDEDVTGLLLKEGYKKFGTRIQRRSSITPDLLTEIITDYFPFDVKIGKNGDDEKINRIVARRYPGMKMPPNSKALKMVLSRGQVVSSGRSRFLPQSKIQIESELLNEIADYIDTYESDTVFYTELFESFKDELRNRSNINCYQFLHSTLKLYFSDRYIFERECVIRKGGEKVTLDEQIEQFLLHYPTGRDMKQLMDRFPGVPRHVLSFAFARSKKIKISENRFLYFNTEAVDIPKSTVARCRSKIEQLLERYRYCYCTQVLKAIGQKDDTRGDILFTLAVEGLPHVGAHVLPPGSENSLERVFRTLLKGQDMIDMDTVKQMGYTFIWPDSFISTFQNYLDENTIRVTDRCWNLTPFTKEQTAALDSALQEQFSGSFIPLEGVNYLNLPEEHNLFTLSSFINLYSRSFDLCPIEGGERRHPSFLIVKKGDKRDFNTLIIEWLTERGLKKFTVQALKRLLLQYNIATWHFPYSFILDDRVDQEGELLSI